MYLFVLFAGSFFAALLSGAAGFGGSLLLLPAAAACLGAEASVPILTVAQLMGNAARMASGWREIDWGSVALFSAAALPLAALGAFGFALLPKGLVTRGIGAALVLLVLAKLAARRELPKGRATLLLGGAATGGLSGLCGSGGPIGAAVFLSLDLSPVAYIASEAAAATAMHVLKIFVYGKLVRVGASALLTGLGMGVCMAAGTYAAKRFIQKLEKGKFQKFAAVLLCAVGAYMAVFGAA